MPKGYPAKFRRRALDLVRSGQPVAQVAVELRISAQAIYTWRKQDEIDRGEHTGLTTVTARNSSPRADASHNSKPSLPPPGEQTSCRERWCPRTESRP
jgi:transposase-like protein